MLIPTNIPAELRERRQWVCWKLEPRPGQEKPTKVPYNSDGRAKTTDGKGLPGSASGTWMTFSDAVALCERKSYSGIGFVFTASDPYVGIDLDHVIDDAGVVHADAIEIIRMFPSAYCELSQSNRGVHIIVRGVLPPGGRRKGFVEAYSEGRYFAITGNLFGGSTTGEIAEHTGALAVFHARFLPSDVPETGTTVPDVGTVALDLSVVIERIRTGSDAKHFMRLYDVGETRPGQSGSESDMALACIFARYIRDVKALAAAMKTSALKRPKWQETRPGGTILERVCAAAIKATPERVLAASATGGTELSLAEILKDGMPLPPPVVVPGLAWAGRVTLVAAREGLGKSTLFAAAAAAVTTGTMFLTNQPTPAGAVLWVLVEEHMDDLAIRAAQYDPERKGFVQLFILDRPEDSLAALVAAIERRRPCLVIIDTLHAFAGPLVEHTSSADDWQTVMTAIDAIARGPIGPAVLMAAQATKAEGDYRDSSAIGHGVDAVFTLRKFKGEGDDGPTRELVCRKARWRVDKTTYQWQGGGLVKIANKVDEKAVEAEAKDSELEAALKKAMRAMTAEYPDGVSEKPLFEAVQSAGIKAGPVRKRKALQRMIQDGEVLDAWKESGDIHQYQLAGDREQVAAHEGLAPKEQF